MEGSERDNTQDWLIPEGSAPPLLSELESRIDEALTIAKSSEKVAIAVGDAAFDAAQQARRAADIAERAVAAAHVAAPLSDAPISPADASLHSFTERADRVAQRLTRLQRVPLAAAATAR